jgi:two-component system, NarL family, invasion response regulator UvrY
MNKSKGFIKMISILIVDDHNVVRFALRHILSGSKDIIVVGEAQTGEEAIQLVKDLKPDIVLMDIQMPGIGGLEATHRLLQMYPDIKIIALTAHEEDPFPSSFIKAGAPGYLTKDTNAIELITAIHSVYIGHSYITPNIAHKLALLQKNTEQSTFKNLTKRELQVMYMLINGYQLKTIADKLHLSIKTISTYRYRLINKLKVNTDVELIHLALRHGILDGTHVPK